MSILLNALNKAKQSDDESGEIESLIDSPIDESQQSEGTSVSKLHGLLIVLLAIIVILLGSIVYLLIDNRSVSESNQNSAQNIDRIIQPQTEQVPSSNNPIEQNATNNLNADELNNSSQANSNEFAELTESPKGSSKSINSEHSDTGSSVSEEREYFEAYKPERQERKTQPKTARTEQSEAKTSDSSNHPSPKSIEPRDVSSELNTNLPIKTVEQLTRVELMMIDEIKVGAHVYSEDSEQRFIFVSGELTQEGDKIINSWKLEAIEPETIIVNNGILRVRLKP
ncbi:general secretion pathway protein GspB [Pleionea sediminis]|uniref:general secretion pathway protein GspB n=1 Tax=Pleionea sediminis TaxID=2569479 RepID=UPI0011855B5E|nr:general secretion pathway protein GspB [Pleionea sediminis]